jgi:hypothetical protein
VKQYSETIAANVTSCTSSKDLRAALAVVAAATAAYLPLADASAQICTNELASAQGKNVSSYVLACILVASVLLTSSSPHLRSTSEVGHGNRALRARLSVFSHCALIRDGARHRGLSLYACGNIEPRAATLAKPLSLLYSMATPGAPGESASHLRAGGGWHFYCIFTAVYDSHSLVCIIIVRLSR